MITFKRLCASTRIRTGLKFCILYFYGWTHELRNFSNPNIYHPVVNPKIRKNRNSNSNLSAYLTIIPQSGRLTLQFTVRVHLCSTVCRSDRYCWTLAAAALWRFSIAWKVEKSTSLDGFFFWSEVLICYSRQNIMAVSNTRIIKASTARMSWFTSWRKSKIGQYVFHSTNRGNEIPIRASQFSVHYPSIAASSTNETYSKFRRRRSDCLPSLVRNSTIHLKFLLCNVI